MTGQIQEEMKRKEMENLKTKGVAVTTLEGARELSDEYPSIQQYTRNKLYNRPGSSFIKRLFDDTQRISTPTSPHCTHHNIATKAPKGFCATAALVVCVAGFEVEALAAATEVAALVLLATGAGVCSTRNEEWLVAAPDPEVARVVLAAGLEEVAAAEAEVPVEACEEAAGEVAGATGTTTGAEAAEEDFEDDADEDFEEDTGAAEAAEEEAGFEDIADDADAADDLDEADGAIVVERGATGTSTETVLVGTVPDVLTMTAEDDLEVLEDFAKLLETLTAATDADEVGLEVDGAEHEAPAWGWPSTYSQMATPLAVAEVVVAAKAAVARKTRAVIVRVMVAVVWLVVCGLVLVYQ
ncbi:hypothetical protein LTR12_003809 [Friedmanniomyces endolithicus]|nr:hypothetical protein LTR12_003809 [Friedmanniomyces endolithicus]